MVSRFFRNCVAAIEDGVYTAIYFAITFIRYNILYPFILFLTAVFALALILSYMGVLSLIFFYKFDTGLHIFEAYWLIGTFIVSIPVIILLSAGKISFDRGGRAILFEENKVIIMESEKNISRLAHVYTHAYRKVKKLVKIQKQKADQLRIKEFGRGKSNIEEPPIRMRWMILLKLPLKPLKLHLLHYRAAEVAVLHGIRWHNLRKRRMSTRQHLPPQLCIDY